MSREAVEMARCFKNKMNEKYPEDLVDIDWDANIRRRIGYEEVELKIAQSPQAESSHPMSVTEKGKD